MSDAWRASGKRGREMALKNRQKNSSSGEGWGGGGGRESREKDVQERLSS